MDIGQLKSLAVRLPAATYRREKELVTERKLEQIKEQLRSHRDHHPAGLSICNIIVALGSYGFAQGERKKQLADFIEEMMQRISAAPMALTCPGVGDNVKTPLVLAPALPTETPGGKFTVIEGGKSDSAAA